MTTQLQLVVVVVVVVAITKVLKLYKARVDVCSENTQTERNHHVGFEYVISGGM